MACGGLSVGCTLDDPVRFRFGHRGSSCNYVAAGAGVECSAGDAPGWHFQQ
jgi:hypothetical protein